MGRTLKTSKSTNARLDKTRWKACFSFRSKLLLRIYSEFIAFSESPKARGRTLSLINYNLIVIIIYHRWKKLQITKLSEVENWAVLCILDCCFIFITVMHNLHFTLCRGWQSVLPKNLFRVIKAGSVQKVGLNQQQKVNNKFKANLKKIRNSDARRRAVMRRRRVPSAPRRADPRRDAPWRTNGLKSLIWVPLYLRTTNFTSKTLGLQKEPIGRGWIVSGHLNHKMVKKNFFKFFYRNFLFCS